MAEKRGSIEYRDDGTNAQLVTAETVIEGSDIAIPVDMQSRYANTIQFLNAVIIGASATSGSGWIDCDGYDKIAGTLKNDASATNNITIEWSNDGVTAHGTENIISNGTGLTRAGIQDVKARYARVSAYNGDAASRTMSAWVYLKV